MRKYIALLFIFIFFLLLVLAFKIPLGLSMQENITDNNIISDQYIESKYFNDIDSLDISEMNKNKESPKEVIVSNYDIKLKELRNTDNLNVEENNKNDSENIIKEIANEKILLKEAEKNNITLSEIEKNNIKNIVDSSPIDRKGLEKINKNEITESEFRNIVYRELENMQIRLKLKEKLVEEIYSNAISFDNEEFKNKVNDFNKKNEKYNKDEILGLLNEYISLLEKEYTIIRE